MDTETNNSIVYSEIVPKPGVQWLPAATILHNDIYGNYMAASRTIQEGEVILDELPLGYGPYGTPSSDDLPWYEHAFHDCAALLICVSCGKPLQGPTSCSKCRWPVCDQTCENDHLHSNVECPIFAQNGVLPEKLTVGRYNAIVVLRILFAIDKNPAIWNILQNMESQSAYRRNLSVHSEELEFITDFIREKCKLVDYDPEKIERIRDCVAVNSYWSQADHSWYMWMFCLRGSLVIHDCNPNCDYISGVKNELIVDGVKRKVWTVQFRATRIIEPNEPITICYVVRKNVGKPVFQRQRFLQE